MDSKKKWREMKIDRKWDCSNAVEIAVGDVTTGKCSYWVSMSLFTLDFLLSLQSGTMHQPPLWMGYFGNCTDQWVKLKENQVMNENKGKECDDFRFF